MQLLDDTVDGRNPAPVDMVNVPLFRSFLHFRWLFGISEQSTVSYYSATYLPTWRQSRDELLFANLAANAQKNLMDFSPMVP